MARAGFVADLQALLDDLSCALRPADAELARMGVAMLGSNRALFDEVVARFRRHVEPELAAGTLRITNLALAPVFWPMTVRLNEAAVTPAVEDSVRARMEALRARALELAPP
jgi:hypothetical protein